MSYIKINSDLFLGVQELNRLIKSLDNDGFRKLFLKDSIQFGLFDNSIEGNFDNFLIQQGTAIGTLKHNEGYAVDLNGQIIYKAAYDGIAIIDNSNWYWIKISHAYSPIETGTVAIDKSGNLTGVNTEFLTVLRGLPNNPIRISFPNSSLNIGEYDVQEVINNTAAILAGDFLVEGNLQYQIVGSFTPDIVVPTASKNPFQYDSCDFSLVLETVLNTPPTLIDGEEFVIARVKRTGSNITIQDKRKDYIYKSKTDFQLNDISESDNPLIGIESSQFNQSLSPRNQNIITIAWGFRSSNWTYNSSTNTVTLLGGNGGKYKSTADFVDDDFNNWKLYIKGKLYKVKQSSVAALQINLVLDTLNTDDFSDSTQEIHVVPNAEEIEIIATPVSTSTLVTQRFNFSINEAIGKLNLEVFKTTSCQYTITYRYKTFEIYSIETLIPDDGTSGYYIETSFDSDGILTGINKQTYNGGIITLLESISSYNNVIGSLTTGNDLFGLELLALSNVAPNNVYDFVVGTRKTNVIISQDTDLSDSVSPSVFQFTVDQFINLKTDEPSTLRGGNSFWVELHDDIIKGAYNFYIVQDWVSTIDPGVILYTFTAQDYDLARNHQLFFKFIFDKENNLWIVQKLIGGETDAKADDLTKGIATFDSEDFSDNDNGIISLKNSYLPIVNYTFTTSSGGGTQTAITIAFASGKNYQVEVTMLAKHVSGSSPSNSASWQREVYSFTTIGGSIASLATDALVNRTNDASSPTLSASGSILDLLVNVSPGSGDVFDCTFEVSILSI